MKYLVCQQPGIFSFGKKPLPQRKSGEALVKINQFGICGTDFHAYAGQQAFFQYPRILGHELAGEITDIDGNTDAFKSGEKVIIIPYVNCGKCKACQRGKTNCCVHMNVLGVHIDGGMQEYITIPKNLLLPAGLLKNDEISIVEPLAIGAHAIKRASIKDGDKVLVMGCGPIGLGLMVFAKKAGATVIALDLNERRLKSAQQIFGAEFIVKAGEKSVETVKEITDSQMVDVVFDATGNRHALESGINYMGHGGKYVLVGIFNGNLTFHHPSIHAKEASILCSRNATKEDFTEVIRFLELGLFPVENYITHRCGFDEMIDVFDDWLEPESGVIKAVVQF